MLDLAIANAGLYSCLKIDGTAPTNHSDAVVLRRAGRPPASVANLAFFPQHWACFGGYLRDFFVSCGLRIFGLVLTTLVGFWAYVMFSCAFPNLWAIIPPADVS